MRSINADRTAECMPSTALTRVFPQSKTVSLGGPRARGCEWESMEEERARIRCNSHCFTLHNADYRRYKCGPGSGRESVHDGPFRKAPESLHPGTFACSASVRRSGFVQELE